MSEDSKSWRALKTTGNPNSRNMAYAEDHAAIVPQCHGPSNAARYTERGSLSRGGIWRDNVYMSVNVRDLMAKRISYTDFEAH